MLYIKIKHCQTTLYTQIQLNTLHLPSHTSLPIKSPVNVSLDGFWLFYCRDLCQSSLIQYAQPTRIKLSLAFCPRCSDMSQHPWFYLIPGISFYLYNPYCIHVEIWALFALTYRIRIRIWRYGMSNTTFCADLSKHISVIDFSDCWRHWWVMGWLMSLFMHLHTPIRAHLAFHSFSDR